MVATGAIAVAAAACGGSGSATASTAAGAAATGAAASAPAATTITVGSKPAGPAVPDGFVGLSFEFRGLEEYFGSNPSALSPAFVQLVRNIAPAGSPVLRIGGDSTDWSWWPVPHLARPGGVRYSLDSRWMSVARAAVRALNAKLLLGVQFEADNAAVAAAEARAFLSGVGARAIEALELGNEPELYPSFPWYKAADGTHVRGRPTGYNFAAYVRDFARIAGALPKVPLAGPSSGSPTYLSNIGPYLSAEPRVGVVTIHAYPLKHCVSANHPTIAQLLNPAAAGSLAYQAGQNAATAHQHGVRLRVDEMNSVSCGGQPGVTDAFAPALWALGELFRLEQAGVDGVNWQTVPNTLQHLIASAPHGSSWNVTGVEPEYYGLVAFAQAAPVGAQPLAVSGSSGGLQAYAAKAPSGALHVVLINTTGHSVGARVAAPATYSPGTATVTRLTAPSLAARSGTRLGGQAINAATGALTGRSTAGPVAAVSGAYPVTVAAGSAAILAVG